MTLYFTLFPYACLRIFTYYNDLFTLCVRLYPSSKNEEENDLPLVLARAALLFVLSLSRESPEFRGCEN
jgi:hypothetical protein